MGSLDRIAARRAELVEEIGSARTRIAARRRMVSLELELARARHPAAHLLRHLPAVISLLGVAMVGGRAAAGRPAGGVLTSVLATVLPLFLERLRRR
jgi:hypothetical protein